MDLCGTVPPFQDPEIPIEKTVPKAFGPRDFSANTSRAAGIVTQASVGMQKESRVPRCRMMQIYIYMMQPPRSPPPPLKKKDVGGRESSDVIKQTRRETNKQLHIIICSCANSAKLRANLSFTHHVSRIHRTNSCSHQTSFAISVSRQNIWGCF